MNVSGQPVLKAATVAMSLRVPPLHTDRLVIREFRTDDLNDIHRILDLESDRGGGASSDTRSRWLEWSIMSYAELESLNQPPFGDRAVTLRDTGELVGATGYAPLLHPLSEMLQGTSASEARWLPEMGLYYALAPAHRGNGYATEAARALISYAFEQLNVQRIVANTEFDNRASQRVMERLGMKLYRNATGEPHWFQVLGVLDQADWVQARDR